MGIRWYVAYPLSTRHVEELMEERGVEVDHSTINRWVIKYSPQLDEVFLQLKALLEPFGLTRYDTAHWGAYTRHLDPDVHGPGKRNTQKIERKHLT